MPGEAESELVKEFIRNRDVLMGYVMALTRDHDLAEELFQDIAVGILTEAQKGTRPDRFMPWARALARNRTADYFRKRARLRERQRSFELLADVVGLAFDEHEPTGEDSRRRLKFLRDCLQGLGAQARRIVNLRYRDRRTLQDIAAAVSWKPDSVKVALAKARRALADCVNGKLRAQNALAR